MSPRSVSVLANNHLYPVQACKTRTTRSANDLWWISWCSQAGIKEGVEEIEKEGRKEGRKAVVIGIYITHSDKITLFAESKMK